METKTEIPSPRLDLNSLPCVKVIPPFSGGNVCTADKGGPLRGERGWHGEAATEGLLLPSATPQPSFCLRQKPTFPSRGRLRRLSAATIPQSAYRLTAPFTQGSLFPTLPSAEPLPECSGRGSFFYSSTIMPSGMVITGSLPSCISMWMVPWGVGISTLAWENPNKSGCKRIRL